MACMRDYRVGGTSQSQPKLRVSSAQSDITGADREQSDEQGERLTKSRCTLGVKRRTDGRMSSVMIRADTDPGAGGLQTCPLGLPRVSG